MAFDVHDLRALERAVQAAREGSREVEPNPPVGAVLYRREQILAVGFHAAYGEAHAEVDCLRAVPVVPEDATLAVTLEPCSTHGKQPPCIEALIERRVRRVVIGELDPNERHHRRGVDALRAHGIEVELAPAGVVPADLLAGFHRFLCSDRPHVVLKWAAGLDGRWGPARGGDRWISGPEARQRVHQLRAHVDAVVIGSGTALADDPLLTARPPGPLSPARVVLDGRGRLPRDSRLVQSLPEAPLCWVTGSGAREVPAGVDHLPLDDPHDLQDQVLPALRRRGFARILVEGGPTLAAALLSAGVVDRAQVFVAAVIQGGSASGGPLLGGPEALLPTTLRPALEHVETVGCDALFHLSWRSSA